MKNFGKKSTNRRRVITTPDEGAPRIWCLPIWWDPSASQLMAGSGDSTEPVLSPRHMAQLCERASRVVVLGYDDQAPAMSALGEVCPPEKISVVYGVKSRPPLWDQESLRNQDIDIIQRPYIVPYDYPLGRLQSTISLSTDADVISLFQATVAGEFHEFWGLPLTVEAAKLWAAVGDVFRYSLPANIESIEFRHNIPKCILSAIRPKRPASNPAESDGDVSVARIVARILDTLMGRSRTRLPLKSCRVESIANVVFKRRAIRRLLPLAWAGTHDPRSEVQKRAADSSSGALNDPRKLDLAGAVERNGRGGRPRIFGGRHRVGPRTVPTPRTISPAQPPFRRACPAVSGRKRLSVHQNRWAAAVKPNYKRRGGRPNRATRQLTQ